MLNDISAETRRKLAEASDTPVEVLEELSIDKRSLLLTQALSKFN